MRSIHTGKRFMRAYLMPNFKTNLFFKQLKFRRPTMIKKAFTSLAFLTVSILSIQAQCPEYIKTEYYPYAFREVDPLRPDPCAAKEIYPFKAKLIIGPENMKREKRYRVSITSRTDHDPNTCTSKTVELKRDSVLVEDNILPERTTETFGGFYMARAELMKELPATRPANFMAVLVPEGQPLAGYWAIGYKYEYKTINEAKKGVRELKKENPEFCSSFAWLVPKNCKFKYFYE